MWWQKAKHVKCGSLLSFARLMTSVDTYNFASKRDENPARCHKHASNKQKAQKGKTSMRFRGKSFRGRGLDVEAHRLESKLTD